MNVHYSVLPIALYIFQSHNKKLENISNHKVSLGTGKKTMEYVR